MEANKTIYYYHLKLVSGKYRIMMRVEQPKFIFLEVGEVSTKDQADRHVERLNKCEIIKK